MTLDNIFLQLGDNNTYKDFIKARFAKIVLTNSVIRVFAAGSKERLLACLNSLEIDSVLNIQSQDEYDNWHNRKAEIIYDCLTQDQENLLRLGEGLRWGHAYKVFNLFIGHLVFYSPYFNQCEALNNIKFYLHVPLDNKVFAVLKNCDVNNVPESIKSVAQDTYFHIQNIIREAGRNHGLPALYFDEYAWTPDRRVGES